MLAAARKPSAELADHELRVHATVVQNVKYFYVSQTDVGSLMDFNF
jgi:hypothetical protein